MQHIRLYILTLALTLNVQHLLSAEQISTDIARQQCLKSAHNKYDTCIEAATKIITDDAKSMPELNDAHDMLQGGCSKTLEIDLPSCHKQYLHQ